MPFKVISSNFTHNKASKSGCIDLTETINSSFTSCNFLDNTLALNGAVFSADYYVNITVLYCQIDSNKATNGGVFYLTGRDCRFEADYCSMVDNQAEYGRIGYLAGDGKHVVKISNTALYNNLSENEIQEIDGIYVEEDTDAQINISIIDPDKTIKLV